MIVKVERCWSGNHTYQFRVTLPKGERFTHATDEDFDWRSVVSRVLDRIEQRGYARNTVRFNHVN